MMIETSELLIDIERGKIVPVEEPRGMRIVCTRGEVWITQHRCTEDVILGPGQSFRSTAPGAVLVQALRTASLTLHAPAADPRRARSRPAAALRRLQRLACWSPRRALSEA
ncbi:MAG: DUF2917 domain-containing protein [Burkholderiales bacterium]|nr:DUF2917 domain-containing protein [Burkholderiales bacterium]